ncbi:hypothetical protein F5146DRAFT_919754, partial [Armillaria mellea]
VCHEECKESSKRAALAKHFEHCQEKVSNDEGFQGEEWVGELCVSLPSSPFLY